MASLFFTRSLSISHSIQQPPQLQHNHQNLINYYLIRRFHPTVLSPTSILLRWCQNSHCLLPNCREENHPLRCPMSFHSNLLSTSMDSFPKPDSSNPNQRRRETTVCEA
ncbi:hypothetical protein F2Q69_00029913 [Brassica cretica]|uniref:Uncharacterized protein n=1 Tax=Brassica cretica TaxID=69181 RepID=A0A8S9S8U2_BRACR|nr:hypothetical protein F2Q69_00029913 [Brassica cretica]